MENEVIRNELGQIWNHKTQLWEWPKQQKICKPCQRANKFVTKILDKFKGKK